MQERDMEAVGIQALLKLRSRNIKVKPYGSITVESQVLLGCDQK